MKNEKPQINYTNFEFFNIDSLVPAPVTMGTDAYSNFLDESQNFVSEENTNIVPESNDETIQIPEGRMTQNSSSPTEIMENEEAINLDLPEIKSVTNDDLLMIELPETPSINGDLLTIDLPETISVTNDDLLTIELPEIKSVTNDDLLTIDLPETTSINDNPLVDLVPENLNYQPENVSSLQDFTLDVPETQNTLSIDELMEQAPEIQEEQIRMNDLINESSEIIYNRKSSVDVKIQSLEQNIAKFQTMMNPQGGPMITPVKPILKSRDTPINIKPGYDGDLLTFFEKINGPPKWRAMTN